MARRCITASRPEGDVLMLSSILTLLLLLISFILLVFRGSLHGVAILVGLLASFVGDLFLSHRSGIEWRFLAGIVAFGICQLCFLWYALQRWKRWNKFVFAFGMLIYGIYWIVMALKVDLTWPVGLIAALYTVLSLATLAAAIGRNRGLGGWLFAGGIGLLLFSDTLISLREFWNWSRGSAWILPTYYLSQLLVTATVWLELWKIRCHPHSVRRLAFAVAILILLVSGAYLYLLHVLENGILRPQPSKPEPSWPMLRIPVGENRTIAACYRPPLSDSGYTILFSYGSLEDLAGKQTFLDICHRYGYGVIGYDYEGFGSSEGRASLTAALRDVEAVYEYMTTSHGVRPERIIAMGFSMGSGPSSYLGWRHPIAGVVLLGGFASVMQIISPFGGWPGDFMTNSKWFSERDIPLLLFHGTEDQVIPFRNAETNYAAAIGRKRLVPVSGAGHLQSELLEQLGVNRFFQILQEFFPEMP